MKGSRVYWILSLLIPSIFWNCAGLSSLPVSKIQPAAEVAVKTGQKAVQASRPISDSEEYYIGRAVCARILAKYPLYDNPKVNDYINVLGQSLVKNSSRPQTYKGHHFAVLNTPEPNAFACPGGIVLVTRGLIKICAGEDELAAVLAHELAHVAHQDGIHSISQARWSEVLTTLGTETVKQYGGVGGQLVNLFEGSIDDVFKTIVVNGYSRSAEEKADQEAVGTMEKAGFRPFSLCSLLSKMATREKSANGIYRTHPPAAERLNLLKDVPEGVCGKAEEQRAQRFKRIFGT